MGHIYIKITVTAVTEWYFEVMMSDSVKHSCCGQYAQK
jgi:hypothetical protein